MRVSTFFAAVGIAAVAAVLGAPGASASPVTVNFGSTGDNFMYAGVHSGVDYRERNWGAWEHVVVGPNTTAGAPPYRGLLHTDVGSLASVPNLSVQSAALTLTVSSVAKRGDLAAGESYDVELYLLDGANAGWSEGNGDNAVVPGASSWNYRAHNTTPWVGGAGLGTSTASPGLSTLVGTATIHPNAADPNAMQIGDKVSFNITGPQGLAAVQSWATGGTNAGFFLKTNLDTGETNARQGAVYFGSKENVVADRRPELSVTYTTPSGIAIGDVIGVDLAAAGGSATGFNIINSNGIIPDGSVVRYRNGSVIPGVSLSFSGAAGFVNDGAAAGWPGTSNDPYYMDQEVALRDLAYGIGAGSELTLTFAGLNDSLTYDLRTYALYDRADTRSREERITVTDGAGTQSFTSTRSSRWLADTLEDGGTVFEGLKTDGSGNLVVTVTGPVGNNPFLNAVVLQAVPEPGTGLLLMLAGLVGLCFRRRRR